MNAHIVQRNKKNFHVCQIRETIECSPVTFYDGCPFFEPRNLNFELIKLDLNNKDKNE